MDSLESALGAPAHLDKYAKVEWDRCIEEHRAAGDVADLDLSALSAYCMAFSRWKTAEEQIANLAAMPESRGALVVRTKGGSYIQNPLIEISRKAAADMVRYGSGILPGKAKGSKEQDLGASSFLDDLKNDRDLYRKIAAGKRLTKKEETRLVEFKQRWGLSSDGMVSTQEELAKLLNISRRTVIRWKADGMPVEPDGRYDPIRVIEWHDDYLGDPEDGSDVSPKIFWDVEFRKFRAQLAEIDLKKAQGEVISKTIVEELLTDRTIELKKSLLSRARRISPALVGKTVEEIYQALEDDVSDLLRTYSRPSPVIDDAKNKLSTSSEGAEIVND